jgi:predicted dehydrogenase
MRILAADRWLDGYLDETPGPGQVRVRPAVWITLFPVDGQYFVRAGSFLALTAYTREFGLRAVTRKTMSRLHERDRNRRHVGIGLGTVLPTAVTPPDASTGTLVAFVAPCHPACMERVVLDARLVRPFATGTRPHPGTLVHRARPAGRPPRVDEALIGWSPLSGTDLDPAAVSRLVAWLADEWQGPRPGDRRLRGVSPVVTHDRNRPPGTDGRPTAALFGLGHYAKTQIVPHVREHLDLRRVYEIDPVQIGARHPRRWTFDTSPVPREDEPTDVVLIAGYHHTHAPLAVSALRRGAVAVVEKPIVTTEDDLDEVTKLVEAGGRLYACFQRRYSPMNAWLRTDLGLTDRGGGRDGEPMVYSSVVYEEPLPARHWYRWPASRTRLVSNGCHWIDHFLWLNDFAPVRRSAVSTARGGTFTVYVELVNDAVLSLVLTSAGGSRYGLREHTELRANGVTVSIVDGARYTAEAGTRILRRRRINRLDSYPAMYRDICARIVTGATGESAHELAAVADLTLRLDAAATRMSADQPPAGTQ